MGYERDTYYFDRQGQKTRSRQDDSVLEVTSTEHDTYGNPSFDASVFDVEGAKESLAILRGERLFHKELSAIESSIRQAERE